MTEIPEERKAVHARSNVRFAIQAIVYEVVLIIFYGIFVKINP